MPNDNVQEGEESASGEGLGGSGDEEKEGDNKEREDSKVIDSKSRIPNNYEVTDIGVASQDLELEAKESYKLKKSLGI